MKPKLSLKEIKEKRKQTLPARLRAAGLDQTFLPPQKTKATGTGAGANGGLGQNSSTSTLPIIPQQQNENDPKKSKVTRIKLLSRENSVKLTRRVTDGIE